MCMGTMSGAIYWDDVNYIAERIAVMVVQRRDQGIEENRWDAALDYAWQAVQMSRYVSDLPHALLAFHETKHPDAFRKHFEGTEDIPNIYDRAYYGMLTDLEDALAAMRERMEKG